MYIYGKIYITPLYNITNIDSWLNLQLICCKLIYWERVRYLGSNIYTPELVATNYADLAKQ